MREFMQVNNFMFDLFVFIIMDVADIVREKKAGSCIIIIIGRLSCCVVVSVSVPVKMEIESVMHDRCLCSLAADLGTRSLSVRENIPIFKFRR